MAPSPLIIPLLATAAPNVTIQSTNNGFSGIASQWANPGDVLSVLMIIGGEIIRTALAQLSGGYIVPVSFSFGWVAYSFNTLLSTFGLLKLMPQADFKATVINVENNFSRENESWIVGRLLRDHSYSRNLRWLKRRATGIANPDVEAGQQKEDKEAADARRNAKAGGLLVSVYTNDPNKKAKTPERDWLWWSGITVAVLQHIIAVIPAIPVLSRDVTSDYTILLVTSLGTMLAFLTGALPQWRAEKWACREISPNKSKTVAITQGNGSRHVIVIQCDGGGLNFEDLATGCYSPRPHTRAATTAFAVMWIGLLITVRGSSQNSWYLMAIGTIGMIQNVLAAGAARKPSAFGVHLVLHSPICKTKPMKTLERTEELFPGVGAALLPIFFPGDLKDDEIRWWREARERRLQRLKKVEKAQ